VIVGALDRERLEAIVSDRNRPRKHLGRACILLASAYRRPAQQVAQSIGVSRPTVWRWFHKRVAQRQDLARDLAFAAEQFEDAVRFGLADNDHGIDLAGLHQIGRRSGWSPR
jgi:hypothetical protein